ncbi:MAG: DUF1501 domain-containing protein [Pirellulales bacterium]|nr:DUF1501 domain-containing protein [Pirellulales bacterium]
MNHLQELHRNRLQLETRRLFLHGCGAGLGAIWLGAHAQTARANTSSASADPQGARDPDRPLAARAPHFPARAKRIIFMHMAGAPSQLELFDYKPQLKKHDGQDCPAEFLEGKRFAFIRGVPQLMGSIFPFHQAGQCGAWISDRLPHFESVIDKVCFIKTLQTDQFNHAPAQLLLHTGNQNFGYASDGAWVTYGLGSENQNMPGYVVLLSGGHFPDAGKAAWGSGFLPGVYQGVQCRSAGDPVLFLSNPPGIDGHLRRQVVSAINKINRREFEEIGDPETVTRISQYEMAYRMQMAASDAMDLKQESQATLDAYNAKPGEESFGNNCLLARRLTERGVRYIQLFDWGWDSHGSGEDQALNGGFVRKCEGLDKPVTALLKDLDQRGLLDETLVVWSGEFGRTPMRENRGGVVQTKFYGRDHHPSAFTVWLAGGGAKPGYSHGETDPIGYSPATTPVQLRDLQATLLHLMGLDFQRLTYSFQGLNQKLTGVKPTSVIKEVVA